MTAKPGFHRLTITDIVEEGTYVDSGDYVATLDHQAVEEQLKAALLTIWKEHFLNTKTAKSIRT
jgi:phosphotransferase system IIA component